MEIIPVGDSALIVRVRERFEDASEETLDEVLRTFQQLRSAAIPGVVELASAYTTVAVFFDPIAVAEASGTSNETFGWLTMKIDEVLNGPGRRGRVRASRSDVRLVEVPVCYAPEFAPDLDDVACRAELSAKEVINLHSAAEYRVACIGFVPGFPFLEIGRAHV